MGIKIDSIKVHLDLRDINTRGCKVCPVCKHEFVAETLKKKLLSKERYCEYYCRHCGAEWESDHWYEE